MKYIIVLLVMVCSNVFADWSAPQVRYWANGQGVTADTSGVVVSVDKGIESGWDKAWGVKPTKAQCEAVDYNTALTWTRAQDEAKRKAKKAKDMADGDAGLAAMAAVNLLKEKNPTLVIFTRAELEAEIDRLENE